MRGAIFVSVVFVLIVTRCGYTQPVEEPTGQPLPTATATSRPVVTPVSPSPTLTATATPTPILPTLTPTASPPPFPKSRADWTSYTNSNDVTGLAFDGDGYLWATSSGGVVRWNLSDGTYEKYTSEDGLSDHRVTSIAVAPDGTLWFGTIDGVVHFDREAASGGGTLDKVWTTYTWADGLPGDWITSIAVAPDGVVWVGTLREGVARYDGTAWIAYDTHDGLVSNDVRAVAVASDGEVWFGTCALHGPASTESPPCFGVSRLGDVGTPGETWTAFSEEDGLANNRVNAIAIAPDGAVWFGTGPLGYYPWAESSGIGGVSRFDPSADSGLGPSAGPEQGGEAWTAYAVADGLADNWVNSIAVAPDGAMWFGTAGGLSRFDGTVWRTYTVADGLAGTAVQAIAVAPDGMLCAGTGGGVSCFDGAGWTTFVSDGPVANHIPAIAVAPDGTVWAGSGEPVPGPVSCGRGISRFVPSAGSGPSEGSWTVYTTGDGLADNTVASIAVAPDGTVWAATGDPDEEPTGVSRFDGKSWTTYTTDDGLASDDVRSIAVGPDGVVWFASWDGLTRFDPAAGLEQGGEPWKTFDVAVLDIAVGSAGVLWGVDDSGSISRFVQEKSYPVSGPASDRVQYIATSPGGTAWVGTSGAGVSYFDGGKWTTYTTDDGMVDHDVTDIAVAPDGVLWVATSSGVSRFDGTSWVSFTQEDGLASNYVDSVAVGADGAVWFGTGSGISRYLPPE